jgi:hypothetical protein
VNPGEAGAGPEAAPGTAAAAQDAPGTAPPARSAAQAGPAGPRAAGREAEAGPAAAETTPHGAGIDPGGLLYGTIVSAAALAVGATTGDTVGGMFETMVSTLLIYWLAHVYVATVSARRPGTTVPLHRLIAASARHEASILVGGLPAVLVVAILHIAHVSLWATVVFDVTTVIVVLVLDGLLAGLHAGARGWRLGVEAAIAAVFGGMIAALLFSLHRH